MAPTNRLTKRYLEHLVSNKDELYQQGFEPLLRYLDANAPLAKRVGYSISPKQDAFRLGQTPLLHFHSSAFTSLSFDPVNANYKLKNSYLGLFGVNGALPTHITEYAIERKFRYKDDTFNEFVDIFHHRFLSLFYRAWSDAQPCVSHDHKDADLFAKRISVFAGREHQKNKGGGIKRNTFAYLAGLYSQKNRSASSLSQILSEHVGHNIVTSEFDGQWYELQQSERCQLGSCNATLGVDSILGARTYQRGFNFSIVIGPLSYLEYITFLSNKTSFSSIKKLTHKSVGAEYSFSIKLALYANQTQASYLGKARLGINSWCQGASSQDLQNQAKVVYERAC